MIYISHHLFAIDSFTPIARDTDEIYTVNLLEVIFV